MDEQPLRASTPRRPRRGRLSRSAEFERVYRQGRSHAQPALRRLRVPARRRRTRRASACPSRARSAAPSIATASSACCARPSQPRRTRARGARRRRRRAPGARELAEREGLAGVRARCASCSSKAGRRVRPGGSHRAGADRPLPARDLAGAAAALPVRADVLGLRGRGDAGVRHTSRPRAGGLAPAALQPVQPRRLRPGAGPAPVPRPSPRATPHEPPHRTSPTAPAHRRRAEAGPRVLPRHDRPRLGLLDRRC